MVGKNINRKEYSVRRGKYVDGQKYFLVATFFRDFKIIEVSLNDTTYNHYNSLVTDKKTNSTIRYSWYGTGLYMDNEYNQT